MLMLSGCTSGSESTQASPSRSTVTPAATATATALGEPIVHGPTAFVSSQEVCTLSDEVRGLTCEDTSNDPRVAGTARYILHQNRWGDAGNGALVQWGAARLTNSGGTWVGRFEGIYTSETGDTVTTLFVGSGDYAGLSYYRWEYKTFGLTWQTEGLIFPGTIPSH
jgi:hypothetical protein